MRVKLIDQLIRHEGYRQFLYMDTVGKRTIGIGRNLDDVGISEKEARIMLEHDIEKAWEQLEQSHPIVSVLSPKRQDVLINMTFNMGIGGVSSFKRMWKALQHADFSMAAIEMLDSKWARQVGSRATELAVQMEEDVASIN